jgi:hypothetical protein
MAAPGPQPDKRSHEVKSAGAAGAIAVRATTLRTDHNAGVPPDLRRRIAKTSLQGKLSRCACSELGILAVWFEAGDLQ